MPVPSRPFIILLKTPLSEYEAWEDLKKCCFAHGWSYNTISKKTLPALTTDGYTIHRISVQ